MKTLLILAALIAAALLYMLVVNLRVPTGLGVERGKLASLPGTPNAVSSQADESEFLVEPFPFKDSAATTLAALKKAMLTYGGIVIVTERADYLHAVHTTPRMRFKDDLEFYLDEASQQVHFRSASRTGLHDHGLNRARYRQLMELYRAE